MISETFRNTKNNGKTLVVGFVVKGEGIIVDVHLLEFV